MGRLKDRLRQVTDLLKEWADFFESSMQDTQDDFIQKIDLLVKGNWDVFGKFLFDFGVRICAECFVGSLRQP